MSATVQIDDIAALGIARTALMVEILRAADYAIEAIDRFKDPRIAGIWAKNAATIGRAYITLSEAKFL